MAKTRITDLEKLRNAFASQKCKAIKRRILWKLTFSEWLEIWENSGHLHERGRRRGQYCMSRFADIGPYSKKNVKIIPHGENVSEAHKGKPRFLSIETRWKISVKMLGNRNGANPNPSAETRRKWSENGIKSGQVRRQMRDQLLSQGL